MLRLFIDQYIYVGF